MSHNDPKVSYDYQDYIAPDWDDCVVIVATKRTTLLAASALRTAGFFRTRWHDDGSPITDSVKLNTVCGWVEQATKELLMPCEIEILLDRIATSLEAIQAVVEVSVPVTPQNGYLKPYVDEIEDVLQNLGLGINGITVPITETP